MLKKNLAIILIVILALLLIILVIWRSGAKIKEINNRIDRSHITGIQYRRI